MLIWNYTFNSPGGKEVVFFVEISYSLPFAIFSATNETKSHSKVLAKNSLKYFNLIKIFHFKIQCILLDFIPNKIWICCYANIMYNTIKLNLVCESELIQQVIYPHYYKN